MPVTAIDYIVLTTILTFVPITLLKFWGKFYLLFISVFCALLVSSTSLWLIEHVKRNEEGHNWLDILLERFHHGGLFVERENGSTAVKCKLYK